MEFILQILILIIPIIIGLIALYFAIKTGFMQKLEPHIVKYITEAEQKYGKGKGTEKFEYVFDKLYEYCMPDFIEFFISAEEARQLIQFVFDKIKVALDFKEVA